MVKSIYDGFDNWADVSSSYTKEPYWDYDDETLNYHEKQALADKKRKETIPEPDEVLVAYYSYENYSGTSWVVYRIGDQYYENYGSHCSCYGLEDQWSPESIGDVNLAHDIILKRVSADIKNVPDEDGYWNDYEKELIEHRARVLAHLEELIGKNNG